MMRRRKDRTFDRYYEGQDGLRHVVRRHCTVAACGQSLAGTVKSWGGPKELTCLQCIGT